MREPSLVCGQCSYSPHNTIHTFCTKVIPASSMANSSSQLVFSIPGQGVFQHLHTGAWSGCFWRVLAPAAWQVTLTLLQRRSSATKGSVCTGKPSISCVLGKKRVIWSLHVSPHPDCSAPADPSQPCSAVLSYSSQNAAQCLSAKVSSMAQTGGNSTKRGELQRISKECKEYSKTKGLEETEVFSKS